jgi:O-antigen/teichoic acid export membrane protein
MLSGLFLGANATALLVYAKQIVGAGAQVTGFIRRVEFPQMLQRLAARPEAGTGELIALQKLSLGFGALLTLAIFLASLVMISMFGGFTREAWLLLSIFCLTILSESIGQSLVQILFARGLFAPTALIRILAVVTGVGFGYLFIGQIGIAVFAFSDFCSHAVVIGLSLVYLARRARAT